MFRCRLSVDFIAADCRSAEAGTVPPATERLATPASRCGG